MFGIAIGTIVEVWDSKAIRYLVEKLIIPQLVKIIFPNGRMIK